MEKNNLERIRFLETVLKECFVIVNSDKMKIKGMDSNVNFISSFLSLSIEECFKQWKESLGLLELSDSDILPLILSFSNRGQLKMKFFEKISSLYEKGLLNSSNQLGEIIKYSKMISILIQKKAQEITDIEKDHYYL